MYNTLWPMKFKEKIYLAYNIHKLFFRVDSDTLSLPSLFLFLVLPLFTPTHPPLQQQKFVCVAVLLP